MKKSYLIPSFIGLGLLAWYFLRQKKFANVTKLVFRGIKITGKGLKRKINLSFGVQNPTNESAKINSITGSVSVNGKNIADFSSFQVTDIKPNAETPLQITAQLSQGIISLLLTKGWLKGGVTYNVTGTMNANNLIVPFNFASKLI